jgi:hypothetical protein
MNTPHRALMSADQFKKANELLAIMELDYLRRTTLIEMNVRDDIAISLHCGSAIVRIDAPPLVGYEFISKFNAILDERVTANIAALAELGFDTTTLHPRHTFVSTHN